MRLRDQQQDYEDPDAPFRSAIESLNSDSERNELDPAKYADSEAKATQDPFANMRHFSVISATYFASSTRYEICFHIGSGQRPDFMCLEMKDTLPGREHTKPVIFVSFRKSSGPCVSLPSDNFLKLTSNERTYFTLPHRLDVLACFIQLA